MKRHHFPLALMLLGALALQARAGWVVLYGKSGNRAAGISREAMAKLREFEAERYKVMAFTPGGGWVLLYGKSGLFARNIPDAAYEKMLELGRAGAELKSVAFAPGGGWVVLHDQSGFAESGLPPALTGRLRQLARAGAQLKQVAFAPRGGWVVLYDKSGFAAEGVPAGARSTLEEMSRAGSELKWIAFPPGGWVLLYDQTGYVARGIPDPAFQEIVRIVEKEKAEPTAITFTLRDLVKLGSDDAETRTRVEALLERHHVPGVSVALVEGGRIAWARGYGVRDAGGDSPISSETLFQAASVSKPVAALAALRLAAQGKFDLDEDVNRYLKSWKVPDNRFTREEKVTARRLLSHCAGMTVGGFGGYEMREELPTLVQVLRGRSPANSPAIVVDVKPGSKYRYSGGGYCVVQQLLIDLTGQTFPALAEELALRPTEMRHSTFQQPLPRPRRAQAATAHSDGKPIKGKWHVYPEMAAAGLWTTPEDLARFALAVSEAWHGRGDVLPAALARQMLTPQVGAYGLGLGLSGKGKAFSFSHNGVNEGFRARLVFYPETGQGAALMGNADEADALLDLLTESLAAEYHWPQ